MRRTGIAEELIPSASPAMMFVAEPVLLASVIVRMGFPAVYHSVTRPTAIPTRVPERIAQNAPSAG
jgi:hypothetical protein